MGTRQTLPETAAHKPAHKPGQTPPRSSTIGTISGDYHLKAGSTAINNGTTACALSGCAPSTDFDGKARPQGAAIDIGAYEQ